MPEELRASYWVCKDGISRQATAKPLGRVAAIVRGGKYLTGDIVYRAVSLASIDQNAATSVQIYNDNFAGGLVVGAGHYLITGFAPASSASNFDCTAIVTLTIDNVVQVTGMAGDLELEIAYNDSTFGGTDPNPAGYSYSTNKALVTATAQSYALQWQFSHIGANMGGLARH
jgi:hypothetical protein